jgi:tetratricopeptide (TPR) repeat protein
MTLPNTNRILIKAWPVLVVALIFLIGCGGKGRFVPEPEESRSRTARPMSARGYNHFVNANLLELFGLYPDALKEYKNALRYFPKSPTIRTDYARLLFRLQRIPEALEQALLIEPKTSDVSLLIGDCYRLKEQPDLAMEYYGLSIELDPDNINAYWYMAGYYRQTGKSDSAINIYYQLARLSDTYRIWQELGTMLGQNKRYKEALDAYNKSIDLNSGKNNINSYLGLATTYDALDSLERAEEAYEKAVELDPYDVRIFRHMQAMYIGRGEAGKAITASEKLVSLVPSDWVAQRRLGVLLYSDGRLERADSLFGSRIEFGDENILNFFYRGRIALEQERFTEASDFLHQTIRKDSSFADGWLNLGFVYRELDSLDKAVEVLRRGIGFCADDKDKTRLLFSLGAVLERIGQFYEAVTVFRELININSEHAPALNYLGYMLADRGEQLAYALELIERAIAISPDNGAYIDSYGWVHYKLGNYDLALTELERAANLINGDPVIFEHLGDVYKALGNNEEALQYYNRALELDPDSLILEEKFK